MFDPWQDLVEEIELAQGPAAIAQLIAAGGHPFGCNGIDSLPITPDRETLWLDDTFGEKRGMPVWWVEGCPYPMAGRAVCVRIDEDGETRSSRLSCDRLRSLIRIDGEQMTAGEVRWTHSGYLSTAAVLLEPCRGKV